MTTNTETCVDRCTVAINASTREYSSNTNDFDSDSILNGSCDDDSATSSVSSNRAAGLVEHLLDKNGCIHEDVAKSVR